MNSPSTLVSLKLTFNQTQYAVHYFILFLTYILGITSEHNPNGWDPEPDYSEDDPRYWRVECERRDHAVSLGSELCSILHDGKLARWGPETGPLLRFPATPGRRSPPAYRCEDSLFVGS